MTTINHSTNLTILTILRRERVPYPPADVFPPHMISGVAGYLALGRDVGGFLSYFLAGDLFNAAANADPENFDALANMALWCCHNVPAQAYGSRERFEAWLRDGGLKGKRAMRGE